jgi:hypothetical protein
VRISSATSSTFFDGTSEDLDQRDGDESNATAHEYDGDEEAEERATAYGVAAE